MSKVLRRIAALMMILALLSACLTGCGSAPQEETAKPFRLLVMAPHVAQENVSALGESLSAQIDSLAQADPAPLFTAHSMGGEEVADPSILLASNMQIVGMASNRELNIIICDERSAMQFSGNGLFTDPTELFTQEELAPYADRILDLDIPDMEGNPSGETTGPIGIDLSHSETFRALTGEDTAGLYIVDAGHNPELSKEVFFHIANMN